MKSKYFTPTQVSLHNSIDDLWLSFLGDVYNLTSLCEKYKGNILLKPIIEAGGTDISHWFDMKTKDIRQYMDPVTNCKLYYTPYGRFVHIPPPFPTNDSINDYGRPWWKDTQYIIGKLSTKTRQILLINTLTKEKHFLEICSEDTVHEILERYLYYNSHCTSYTVKYDRKVLDMEKTLAENNVPDEDEEFYQLKINNLDFPTTLHIYYNDDLTEA